MFFSIVRKRRRLLHSRTSILGQNDLCRHLGWPLYIPIEYVTIRVGVALSLLPFGFSHEWFFSIDMCINFGENYTTWATFFWLFSNILQAQLCSQRWTTSFAIIRKAGGSFTTSHQCGNLSRVDITLAGSAHGKGCMVSARLSMACRTGGESCCHGRIVLSLWEAGPDMD